MRKFAGLIIFGVSIIVAMTFGKSDDYCDDKPIELDLTPIMAWSDLEGDIDMALKHVKGGKLLGNQHDVAVSFLLDGKKYWIIPDTY